jgi:hypothetical protein
MFSAFLYKDNKIVGEYDGYVPDFMPTKHYGDYVCLEIDIDTGAIVNWKKPTQAALNKTFKPRAEQNIKVKGGLSYSTFADGQ